LEEFLGLPRKNPKVGNAVSSNLAVHIYVQSYTHRLLQKYLISSVNSIRTFLYKNVCYFYKRGKRQRKGRIRKMEEKRNGKFTLIVGKKGKALKSFASSGGDE
jgi:hypothetical protein